MKFIFLFFNNTYILETSGDGGLGIGDWGLGIGDWGWGPMGNRQTPKVRFPKPKNKQKVLIYKYY